MSRIPFFQGDLPWLTVEQMIEVDRAMIEDYNIQLLQMMENAGRNLARLAFDRFLKNKQNPGQVTILAGSGGNGGGALACARWLCNYGIHVVIMITKSKQYFSPEAAHQLDIVERMSLDIRQYRTIHLSKRPELIIDGVIGYNLNGAPHGAAGDLIRWANNQETRILSLDIPSGIDASDGTIHDPAIQASATMSLALPKRGLKAPGASELVGELYLADISVPPELYQKAPLGFRVPHVFAESDILRLK